MLSNNEINGDHYVTSSKKERNTALISIEQLDKIIECAILSPYVLDEKEIPLLIVAKPESGKTSALKQYIQNEGIVYVTDCTAYGIQRDLLPKIVSGEIKTIIIADLLTPLSKAYKTRESFIAFLNNLIEEGVAKITTYAMIWDKEVKCNVITAVTDQAIKDGRHEWAKLGFLSRFIVFSYSYSLSTVIKILKSYSVSGLATEKKKLVFPKEPVDIKLPEKIADKLDPIATKIGEQYELYGIRAKINLRSLIKALTLRNGKTTVTEKEFQELLELSDYFNFNYNVIR